MPKTPLIEAHHAVLAEQICASINVPQSTNAAVDGFVIRGQDKNANSYDLVGDIYAGHPTDHLLTKNQTMRIMTGAPLPASGDTVIMKEQATVTNNQVSFSQDKGAIRSGQNVRFAGEDLAFGDVVFEQGTRLNAPEIGMLASLGLSHVQTFSPIKVAIFSTGDEVQNQTQPLDGMYL